MSEELKPCPYCKGTYTCIQNVQTGGHQATCYCGMTGPILATEQEAAESWNALPRRLRFSKEKPITPDFYWNRDGGLLRIGEILEISGALFCHFAGEHEPQLLELVGGEWAGPIPEPED